MKRMLTILALLALTAGSALAQDISGSTVTVDPTESENGVVFLCFTVTNSSLDFEWIADITLTLPACMTILDVPPASADPAVGSDPFNPDAPIAFTGYGTNVANWSGTDSFGFGFLTGENAGVFCVSVEVNCACDNVYPIVWDLAGDGFGGAPHVLNGTLDFSVLCSTPTEDSSWGDVKALY